MAEIFSLSGKRIWVAGETGMVGRALLRALRSIDTEILSAPRAALDLTDQAATFAWLSKSKPDVIFMAAAKVGGIGANAAQPADFIRDNLAIAQNVIDGAHRAGVPRLVFLGSSCIYPRDAAQPICEDALMTGPLEPTNEAYAIAKIAGVKLCQFYRAQYGRSYISAMPTNLYGPHDRFDEQGSHVIPAMMMKFDTAVRAHAPHVFLWGSGKPLREFLHVDDLAAALLVTAERYDDAAPVNVGSGDELSIAALAHVMKKITGFEGSIVFDASRPDGVPRKLLDSSKMRGLGWAPSVSLEEGLRDMYSWYRGREQARKTA
ncbi:MAG TPA: GDP-L-fucose synthase [Micavibrio sp.]|nr:GDP-L-fucose synthase [Micavibrio sp.]